MMVNSQGTARAGACGLALALALLPVPSSGQERPALGPLPTSEQSPLHRLQIAPEAEGADVVSPGTLRLTLQTSYSNIFEQSVSDRHEQLFDLEQMSNVLDVRYGLHDRWEVGGHLAIHTGWGGIFDGVFSSFHQGLGLPNGGRETEPSGQHKVVLDGEDPDVSFSYPARTLGLEGISAFAMWQPVGAPGSPYGLSVRATARSSAGPIDPGRIDGSLSIQLRMSGQGEYDGVHLYGMAGLARLDPPEALAPIYSDWAGYFLFGSERRFEGGLAFIFQLAATTPYVSAYDVTELTRYPVLLSLGLAGEREGGWRWHFGFSEDFPPESPSVDLTVLFNVSRTIDLGP